MNETAFTFVKFAEAAIILTGFIGLCFIIGVIVNEIDDKQQYRNNCAVAALTTFIVGTLITFILLTAAVNL